MQLHLALIALVALGADARPASSASGIEKIKFHPITPGSIPSSMASSAGPQGYLQPKIEKRANWASLLARASGQLD